MSSLLGALQKSGGQVRSVTSQAALIKTSLGVWGKEAELNNRLQMNEAQKKYDEEYQKILFLKSSLHELYKIDPVETRMGSVASVVAGITDTLRLLPEHRQDGDVVFRPCSLDQLLDRCEQHLSQAELPPPLPRAWSSPPHTSTASTQGLCNPNAHIRVFQWNILAQAIGTKLDNFCLRDPRVLDWSSRRWRVLEEVLQHRPDVITLQEVDHFNFLAPALASVGYCGRFIPKPDSACKYIKNNNGPDGVAMFYKKSKFECLSEDHKVLEAWGAATNQVALAMRLQERGSGREVTVVTTHLKARRGALLSNIRTQQGEDLVTWVEEVRGGTPVILTGDFNAEPSEPVLETLTSDARTPLQSSYSVSDLEYTTWKIRDSGEEKHVLDYVFHSPELETRRTLDMPETREVEADKFPSLRYASDHLSLVTDIAI